MGIKIPKSWAEVRKAIEQDNRDYISLDEFLKICDDCQYTQDIHFQDKTVNDFTGKDGRLILSQFLHDLGIILHFQDDEESPLYETVILNPTWGTQAVYELLKKENNPVKENLGKFTYQDLKTIWSDARYEGKYKELLELMKRFKLCYQLPHTQPKTYIAPQLLDSNAPEYDWNNQENLRLNYHYEFMPKGILSRFIVEMHPYIEEPKVWRHGVILTYQNTRAEVIETYDSREIQIKLQGNNKRGLLELITAKFDLINNSYKNLKFDKLLPCNCDICKNSQNPYFHKLKNLRNLLNKSLVKKQLPISQCQESGDMVDIYSLIDDTIGREKFHQEQKEDKYSQASQYNIGEVDTLIIQTTQTGTNTMENQNNKPVKVKSSWANGSFYLFTFVVVVAGIGYLAGNLPVIPFVFVIVAGVLFVPIIGALQLVQDKRIKEKSFLKLMKMVIGQLPLIGNMLGNILNPKDKDNN